MKFNNKVKFESDIMAYLLICGVLSNEDINAICKHHNIKISEKEKNDILKEMDLYYDGKHYSRYDFPELSKLFLLRSYSKIRLLNDEEIANYMLYLGNLFDKLGEIIKDNTAEYVFVLATLLRVFEDDYFGCELIKDKNRLEFFEKTGINKNTVKKLIQVFNEYGDKLRYWYAYGRDNYDIDFDDIIEDTLLKKKPKVESLINCLNNLDEVGYENIAATYVFENESVEELKDIIVETMEESVHYFSKEEYNRFINCNHKEITYAFSDNDFMQGFVFAYKEDGVIKTLVPKEIMNVLKSVNVEDLENRKEGLFSNVEDTFDSFIADVIIGYLEMNGVIKKKVLQSLLKKYHDLDMDIKSIDSIIDKLGSHLVHKDYYSIVNDDNIAKSLLKIKSDDYRECTPEVCNIINEYLYEINEICDGDDELVYNINTITRLGGMNKNNMAEIKDEFGLSKSTSNKIYETVNKYKNKLPLWPCNGYNNLNNSKTVKNEKKIGRNEPCPCGSGKKYKKCCGR